MMLPAIVEPLGAKRSTEEKQRRQIGSQGMSGYNRKRFCVPTVTLQKPISPLGYTTP